MKGILMDVRAARVYTVSAPIKQWVVHNLRIFEVVMSLVVPLRRNKFYYEDNALYLCTLLWIV